MINIINKEINVEELLRKRLEIICNFCNTTPTIINGSIGKVDKTNLSYVEPNEIYINSLSRKIKINELENYIKNPK